MTRTRRVLTCKATKPSRSGTATSVSLTVTSPPFSARGVREQRQSGSVTTRCGSCSMAAGTKEKPRSASRPRSARHTANASSSAVGDQSSVLTVHCSTSTGRTGTTFRSSVDGNRSSAPTTRSSAGTSTGACPSSARRPPDRVLHALAGLTSSEGFP